MVLLLTVYPAFICIAYHLVYLFADCLPTNFYGGRVWIYVCWLYLPSLGGPVRLLFDYIMYL
uniref:Putative ovule protein n=1 Tax=Solanum chacoense TaxID=4108 RepID=A0A0V0HQ94_SOLCH